MSSSQRLTLAAAILGSSLAAIDGSIVNVALPAIERDLGGGLPVQQWVSNAYLLALGSLILIGGSLADIFGERRVFTLGVAGFGLLSVACALAPSIDTLIAALALEGAALGVTGLGGVVFALIEQPRYGWASAIIDLPLAIGAVAFVCFLVHERRTEEPMLKLELFARRNFAVANLETLTMYAGLSILFFFLVIFLQQVAGYSALRSGLTTVPVTLVMFALSRRFGALADRYGPRFFMGAGPLIAAAGILLLLRTGLNTSYTRDLLPGLLVFSLGLSMTVAPLTATVMADADSGDAGIASAINNAVARVAGLVGISVIGVVIASTLVGDTFTASAASVRAFHQAIAICAALIAAGGIAGAVGITNPRRTVKAESCSGGQLVGAPAPAAES